MKKKDLWQSFLWEGWRGQVMPLSSGPRPGLHCKGVKGGVLVYLLSVGWICVEESVNGYHQNLGLLI
jgi:hypothetical protein